MAKQKYREIEVFFKESIQRGEYDRCDELHEDLCKAGKIVLHPRECGWDFGTGCSAILLLSPDRFPEAAANLRKMIRRKVAGVTITKVVETFT